MRGLNELAPKAKARRFRTLLPMIEAKIEAGVLAHHHQTSVPTECR